ASASLTAVLDVVAVTNVTGPVDNGNQANGGAVGTAAPGATISLVVSDGNGHSTTAVTALANGSGAWTITGVDLSGLDNGTLTYTATDVANPNATATRTA